MNGLRLTSADDWVQCEAEKIFESQNQLEIQFKEDIILEELKEDQNR